MKNLLFEVSPIDPATNLPVTIRMASSYADVTGVLINGYSWLPLITQGPSRSIRIFSDGSVKPIEISYGNLSFRLPPAIATLSWSTLSWDGAFARLFVGDLGAPWASYAQVFEGRTGALNRDGQIATLPLLGAEDDLDFNLLTTTYAGTGNAEGDAKLKGTLKPRAYGACSNVAPVLIDAAYWIYQVHDGAINDVPMVYENAYQVAASSTSTVSTYAALKALTLAPGQWAKAPAAGMFRLGGQPSGKITCDVQGALRPSDSAYVTTLATIVPVLLKVAGLADAKIDQTSLNAFSGYSWSLYATDQMTVGEAVRDALSQAGGYIFPSSTGVWKAGNWYGSRTAIALSQDRSSTPLVRSIKQEIAAPPNYRIKIGADRCWSTHGDSEISSAIADAGASAAAANAAAAAAQSTANTAAADATTAITRLNAIANDAILDRSEKSWVNAEFQKLTAEKSGINSQATGLGITTENTAYNTAYSTLNTYLSGLSPAYNLTSADTTIVRATWDSNWNGLYAARQTVLNKIAAVAATTANWSGVVGTGKPADNAGSNFSLTTVGTPAPTITGNTVAWAGIPTGAWLHLAYTEQSYVGAASVTFRAGSTTSTIVGLVAPASKATTGYAALAYGWFLSGSNAYYMESGGFGSISGSLAVGDLFSVTYDGVNVRYYKNGTVLRTVSAAAGQTFHAKVIGGEAGASCTDLQFTPFTDNAWASVGGANKPADNATVGAVLGTTSGLTNIYISGGGAAVTTVDAITNLGTAAAIVGQSALATASAANWATQVSGTGKPSDYATADLILAPVASLAANGYVSVTGNTVTRTATGAQSWTNGAFYSVKPLTGNARLSWVPNPVAANKLVSLHLHTALVEITDATINTPLARFTTNYSNGYGCYVNGTAVGSGTYAYGDEFAISYDGVNFTFWINGAVVGSASATADLTLFVLGTIADSGGIAANIKFTPFTENVWGKIAGVGRPSNNAGTSFLPIPIGTYPPTLVGNAAYKATGGNAFNSALSGPAFKGSAYVEARRVAGPYIAVALDTSPTNTGYGVSGIIMAQADGSNLVVTVNGATVANVTHSGAYNKLLRLSYDGTAYRVFLDGVEIVTYASGVAAGQTFYPKVLYYFVTESSSEIQMGFPGITPKAGSTLIDSSGTVLTDANIVTNIGVAASITGQGTGATANNLAGLDSSANTKLSGIAAGATVGATWGSNIASQPTSLSAINSTEATKLSGIATGATVGATWGSNITSQPTSLSGINSTEGTKLSGIASGATVGADWAANVANRPANVAALSGSEGINNAGITLSAAGALSGAGGGAIAYDSVADGSTYAKVLASQLSSGAHKLTVAGSGTRVGDSRNLPAIVSMNLGYKFTGAVTYSAAAGTPATATISVAAGSALIGSNSVSYSAMSANVTGTNNTTTSYWLYVDDASFAGGAATLIATTTSNTIYSADGRVYIGSVDVYFPTSGSGGGGGGGGGGYCVAADSWVETPRGFVPAREIVPGDLVRVLTEDCLGTEWEPVTENFTAMSEAVTITSATGIKLTVSITTPITLRTGHIWAPEIDGHELPTFVDSLAWESSTIEPAGVREVAHIHCSGRTYAAGALKGASILTHNPAKP